MDKKPIGKARVDNRPGLCYSGAMKQLALLLILGLAACGERVVDEQYDTNVPAENEGIVEENEQLEGDERPR